MALARIDDGGSSLMSEITPSSSTQYLGRKLAPFNPINIACAILALEMLDVKSMSSGSVLYDLGCGDGRVLMEACKINIGVRAVGVEYDVNLCERARGNINMNGYSSRVTVLHANVMNADIADASAVFVYLVPEGIRAIEEILLSALDRNVKIVTYVFSIPNITPTRVVIYKGSTKLYLYSR